MPISFNNVDFSYGSDLGGAPALKNINLTINDGEFISIIGHTGSGKSTLLHLINGLILPKSGDIEVDGLLTSSKTSRAKIRKKVALCIQYPERQLFAKTVMDDVCFGPKNFGFDNSTSMDIARESLFAVGLDADVCANRSPFELSGGEKRRVALAGVLACKSKYIILDEPTAGLDPMARERVINLVKEINTKGTTVIMVSHNMDDIAKCSERIAVLKNGGIYAIGKVDEIFSRAEELREINLGIPVTTNFILKLNKMGMNLPTNIYTVEDLADLLSDTIKNAQINKSDKGQVS